MVVCSFINTITGETLTLPYIDPLDYLNFNNQDERYKNINGDEYVLIGKTSLLNISLRTTLSTIERPYNLIGSDNDIDKYIYFFNQARLEKQLLRLIISDSKKINLNITCIATLKYKITDEVGDIPIIIDILEIKEYKG